MSPPADGRPRRERLGFGRVRGSLLLIALLSCLPAFCLAAYGNLVRYHRALARAEADLAAIAAVAGRRQEEIAREARRTLELLSANPVVFGADRRRASAVLARALAASPDYANFGLVDRAGRVVASALPIEGPVDVADRAWYRRAVETRAFAVGDYQVGRITGVRTLNFALPVVDSAGVGSVLFAAVREGRFRAALDVVRLPEGFTLVRTDREGIVVAARPDGAAEAGAPLGDLDRLRPAGTNGRVTTVAGADGSRRLVAHETLRPAEGAAPGGILVAAVPLDVVFAEARRDLRRDLLALAGVLAATLLLAWWAADRLILAPLAPVVGAARRLAGGDLSARAGSPYPAGEIGDVARVFDEAAAAVEAREAERGRHQAALLQARKMEAIGQLAGGVAHDFNNLLTVIRSNLDLAREALGAGHAAASEMAEAEAAADRAAALTAQLLAFSRRQVLAPRVVDPNDVVRSIAGMIGRLLGERIEVRLDLSPSVGPVLVDPHQLEQILVNLSTNARDAMPGGGTLAIATEEAEIDEASAKAAQVPPGRYARVSVSDTGCGMDEATRSRIFEPFFTTKERGRGTGLGLATVYGIVKQSGGHITVYSEPGRGSVFRVYLPRVEGTPEPIETARRSAAAVPGGAETILLVEDEEGIRRAARRALERRGYRVLVAGDGEEAVRLASGGERIDLLVTDVVLPGMDGRVVRDRLVALHPGLRTLFVSGYTEEGVLQNGDVPRDAAFLQKPFTVEGLLRAIRAVLDGPVGG